MHRSSKEGNGGSVSNQNSWQGRALWVFKPWILRQYASFLCFRSKDGLRRPCLDLGTLWHCLPRPALKGSYYVAQRLRRGLRLFNAGKLDIKLVVSIIEDFNWRHRFSDFFFSECFYGIETFNDIVFSYD